MFKRIFFILLCIAGIAFAIWKISGNVIGDEVDNANMRLVEEYADALKLSTYNMSNVNGDGGDISYSGAGIASSVVCERVNVIGIGQVELHGCVIQGNATRKYKYVNGKPSME